MQLYERIRADLIRRRERILSGKVNCIPCSFVRFRTEWPGIQQSKYFGVTGVSKAGKTKLSDKLFFYDPLFYAIDNPDKIRIKIFYFSLEISAEDKYKHFLCHLIYKLSKGKIRISPRELNSIDQNNPLSQEILDIIDSDQYKRYYKFFEDNVQIISSVRNPTGIHKFMKDYAKANGVWHKKTIDIVDKFTGEVTQHEVNDWYESNDPDEYVFCIIDHISLISTESEGGKQLSLHESIVKLSSKYLIELRDDFKYIPVVIQQQAISNESVENIKLGKLKPSVADLGDCKLTARDMNCLIGIFSPFKHELHDYMNYSIDKFRDNIRFMEIIISREGGGGTTCPLYFDGACDTFYELPLPHDKAGLQQVYNLLESIRQKTTISLHLFNIKKEENYVKNFRISKKRFWKNIFNWFNSAVRNYRIRS